MPINYLKDEKSWRQCLPRCWRILEREITMPDTVLRDQYGLNRSLSFIWIVHRKYGAIEANVSILVTSTSTFEVRMGNNDGIFLSYLLRYNGGYAHESTSRCLSVHDNSFWWINYSINPVKCRSAPNQKITEQTKKEKKAVRPLRCSAAALWPGSAVSAADTDSRTGEPVLRRGARKLVRICPKPKQVSVPSTKTGWGQQVSTNWCGAHLKQDFLFSVLSPLQRFCQNF